MIKNAVIFIVHNYIFLVDVFVSIMIGFVVRACIREAAYYKLNKKQKAAYKCNHSLICHIFRAYSPKESHAPRNMTYLQVFRSINIILLLINIILYVFCDNSLCRYIFLVKAFLLYVPFVVYNLYIRFHGPFFNKNIDFSIFKNP